MNKSYANFIKLAMQKPAVSQEKFAKTKKEISKELSLPLPTNADLREIYEKMVSEKKISRSLNLEKNLFSKKVRTRSGVAVIAVLTKPFPCPGRCIYCPSQKNMPKSYLKNEPAVMRAISAKFKPYLQVQKRIRALELNGHATDKIELIVMGGTFSYFPKKYQKWFIQECFRACNDYGRNSYSATKKTKTPPRDASLALEYEHKKNETAKRRVIGLTLETRPDYIDEKEILNFRKLGCTRVELGVQSIFDDVLGKNNRGHSVTETIRATKLLKDAGFKINYHIMPGLLGSNFKKDFQMFQSLFRDENFQPDMLKIYPTVVIKNSRLYRLWKEKKYIPLGEGALKNFILKVKQEIIPPYVRISRLIRDVPENSIEAGPKISNLRQLIAQESACRCIRCREIGANYSSGEKMALNRIDYLAGKGKEIFLEYVSPDQKKLFALLRLRLPEKNELFKIFPILKNSALIREVHTYGKMISFNQADKNSPQHIGLGKKLMQKAEEIAQKEFGARKIVVISGIGAREYYRKLGYRLRDTYMVKYL